MFYIKEEFCGFCFFVFGFFLHSKTKDPAYELTISIYDF